MQRDLFVGNGGLVHFEHGDDVMAIKEKDPVGFLLISEKPIGEPVAWYGPLVMNTQEELRIAFAE